MARIRSIHPGAPADEEVATMSLAARYVWAYLPCHADREGRMKDSPFTIKALIMPADNVDMNAVLDELAARKMIVRYASSDGKRYIQIRTFLRYQNPHKKETPSTIPAQENLGQYRAEPGKAWALSDTDIPAKGDQELEIIQAQEGLGSTGSGPEKTGTGPAVRSDPVQSRTGTQAFPGSAEIGPGPAAAKYDPGLPSDPLSVHGLIAIIRGAVERAQPSIGLYNPGQWAMKAAREFLDAIPEDRRTDELRSEVRARIATFAASTDPRITGGKWLVDRFCENFAALGAHSGPAQISSAMSAAKRMAAVAVQRYRQ